MLQLLPVGLHLPHGDLQSLRPLRVSHQGQGAEVEDLQRQQGGAQPQPAQGAGISVSV